MNALKTYTAKHDTMTLLDSLAILDAIIETEPANKAEERMVRAYICDVLEARYPAATDMIEAWMDDLDDTRTYAQVLTAAIRVEA